MQIQVSATRFGTSTAIGAPTGTNDAGFASLLRASRPTPEPTLAAPVPVPPSAPVAPSAPVPPSAPLPARVPAPVPPSAPVTATTGAALDAAGPSLPAPPGNGSTATVAATAAVTAPADPAEPPSPPAIDAAADAAPASASKATPTVEAALRNQLRARLQAAGTPTTNDLTTRASADPTPSTATEPVDAPRVTKKADTAASHANVTAPDASTLPLPVGTAAPAAPAPADPPPAPEALAARPADARTAPAATGDPAAMATAPDGRAGSAIPSTETSFAGAAFTGVLAEHTSGIAKGESTRPAGVDAGMPTAAGAAAFGSAPVPGSAAPLAVAVATKVDAPNFAQQLGVQLSVLAKDGVQHAELHLNPADMGPVSVHITMDGTQARIDFGAEVAATRHAIENGLPQLAGALADAGFTLAGGGVSSQAGGRGDGGGRDPSGSGASPRRATGGAATEAIAPATRRTVSIGGLDLYA